MHPQCDLQFCQNLNRLIIVFSIFSISLCIVEIRVLIDYLMSKKRQDVCNADFIWQETKMGWKNERNTWTSYIYRPLITLHEKCWNTEFFSGPCFLHWVRIQENTNWKNSVFGYFSRSDDSRSLRYSLILRTHKNT